MFPQITVEFLRRYTIFLRTGHNRNRKEQKPLSDRTVTNHLMAILTLYNRAIIAGLAGKETYPFGDRERIMIKFGRTEKIGLNTDEINQLKQHQFEKRKIHFHHNSYFLWIKTYEFQLSFPHQKTAQLKRWL